MLFFVMSRYICDVLVPRILPCVLSVHVSLFLRYAFLFDKAMFVCKKKGGETFELKEIIELQNYQIRDETSGEKDNKKVFLLLCSSTYTRQASIKLIVFLFVCVCVCEQWSYLFLLLDCNGRCGYDLFFKTRELKKKWLEQFEMAL